MPEMQVTPDLYGPYLRFHHCWKGTNSRNNRRKLATSQHLVPHTPKPLLQPSDIPPGHNSTTPRDCAHLFLDPLSWMRPELEQGKLAGRLECPKCRTNVGKYAWQGMRCSCGDWVIPGISLARGRVDEIKSRTAKAVGLGREGENL